ncbi:MAG: ABC transporter substrate-binding protein [Corynebacterium sp.]|nr:ABC transporter substrate-binding protein [Corynebacterium sp.]
MLKKVLATLTVLAPLGLCACVGPKADVLGQKWGMMPTVERTCPVTVDESVTGTARVGWMVTADGQALLYGNGWLDACLPNMKIQWQKYEAGAEVAQAFGSDSTDLSLIGSSHMASTLSEPLNLNVDMAWIFSVIGTAESLVAKDPNVQSLRDLKGKSIAVSTGSTTHYSLLSAIKQAGMQPTDFNLVFLAPDKMLAGWSGNQLDAAWVWDPTLSKLTETGHIIMSSADTAAAGSPTANVAIVDKTFAANNPGFMRMYWLLQEKAIEQLNDDPDAAAETLSPILNVSIDETKYQLSGYQYLTAEEQYNLHFGDALYSTAQFLQEQGRVTVADKQHYEDAVIIPSVNPTDS